MAKSMKEIQQDLVANMETWQKLETATIVSTSRVIENCQNPIIRLVMEIIRSDSGMHHRVEQWIAESFQSTPVTFSPDELADVWTMIEEHVEMEKKTIQLAQASLEAMKDSKGMLVQSYLLQYLLDDEKKHDQLLDRLKNIQKLMYPYA